MFTSNPEAWVQTTFIEIIVITEHIKTIPTLYYIPLKTNHN
ncbi:hypothetical protein [Escherichia phage vB_EcoM-UFV05]|nr:hypothetical protein [Escherichia phage vB_EcoM-UFV09]UYE93043.1 hypothetical protein [Escherichia phage vB_EcoM-UFV05]UYL83936.1 hypothetical protein [Escherichia phage vB_EcoM-UFV06]UYL84222.1 hypothetical protein [Escherichia phage vB_EcoM-UFV10]UYL84508.1 hypothetical protein [Escherichia phage vB_EcoM-UFV11]